MEDDMEIDSSPFTLKGWINERDSVKGLDRHDPFADELQYPPLTIGTNILSKLKLSISTDNKKYFAPISSDPSLLSETWISNRSSRDEEPDQSGIRLRCSLDFVKYLCRSLKCELILKVQIGRTIHSRYGSYNNSGYKPPLHKIFIISADGKLRGTEVCSQLGRTLR